MSEHLHIFAEWCATLTEALGILIITLTAIHGFVMAAIRRIRKESATDLIQKSRQGLGRGILLGLEFLVAADIIHTVAVELTYQSVTVLAAIVLIRTFLSFTLELELNGRWPWQKRRDPDAAR